MTYPRDLAVAPARLSLLRHIAAGTVYALPTGESRQYRADGTHVVVTARVGELHTAAWVSLSARLAAPDGTTMRSRRWLIIAGSRAATLAREAGT